MSPKLILKPGSGGRCTLGLQLLEEHEHFPKTVQCGTINKTSTTYPFPQELRCIETECFSTCVFVFGPTQVKHEPGVLERKSREPKTSCEGADIMVECEYQRDRLRSLEYGPVEISGFGRRLIAFNLYATRRPFLTLAHFSTCPRFPFRAQHPGTFSHDLVPVSLL